MTNSAKTEESKIYYPQLDILRFMAAIMVCLGHVYDASIGWWGYPSALAQTGTTQLSQNFVYLDMFFRNLGYGVDLFFIISGFLITYILLKEKEATGKINFRNFFIRRSLRIWPLYYLIIAIAPFLINIFNEKAPDYLSNILFIGNFSIMQTEKWEFPFAHFWSICVEEHFYLVWPFVVAVVSKKNLLTAIAAFLSASILYRMYVIMFLGGSWYTLYLHSLSRVDIILVGAILAYYHHKKPIKLNFSVGLRLLIYSIFTIIFFTEHVTEWGGMYNASVRKYFYSSVTLFAIANYLFNEKPIFNFKKINFLHYLGKLSYGIYMYGNIVLYIVLHKLFIERNHNNHYAFAFTTLFLTIIVSIISFELYERPILKIKKRFEIIKTSVNISITGKKSE